MKQEKNIKRGKKSRKSGADFERRVRADLELKGWIVDKWTNNVSEVFEQDIGEYVRELIPAKNKFRGKGIPMMLGKGFPDFIAFKFYRGYNETKTYEIIGVEAKSKGYLDKEEREKCQWYLRNHIFSKILVASKVKIKNRIHIEYREFKNEN